MEKQMGPIPVLGFKELQRISDGGNTYIVGRCGVPETFVLGVMDLTDPKAWSEGVSDLVLYFILTPAEAALRVGNREGFLRLAQSIQQNLPRSRYLFGRSASNSSAEWVDARCRELLKEDALDSDSVFDEWLKENPVKVIHQEQTPYTIARHELYQYQKDFNRKTAPANAVREETRRQKTFARRLMELPCLYAGVDDTVTDPRRPDFPMLEIVTGHAHLFSRPDIAETACEYFRDNHYYQSRSKLLEGQELTDYLDLCEELGVEWIRVDDGIEAVEVRLEYIHEPREWEWLEEENQHLRNAMLHSLQLTAALKNAADMDENWKKTAETQIIFWRKEMLRRAAETQFYVPCALEEESAEKLKGTKAFTRKALSELRERVRENGRPTSALTEPRFEGKLATVSPGENGKLPIRVLNGKEGQQWLIAFTGREKCRAFIEHSEYDDTMLLMSFEELFQQTDVVPGIIMDLTCMGVQLRRQEMQQAMLLKQQAMITIQPLKPKKPEEKKPVASVPAPAEKQRVKAEETGAAEKDKEKEIPHMPDPQNADENPKAEQADKASQTEQKREPESEPERKPGLLERLFGKKKKKE